MQTMQTKAVVGDLQDDCPESAELAGLGYTHTVFILDEAGDVYDMVDFRSLDEAEEYAKYWNGWNGHV